MKQKANNEIRILSEKKDVKLYQIARAYGLNDGNFSRLLRFELPKEKKERILQIIKELSQEAK